MIRMIMLHFKNKLRFSVMNIANCHWLFISDDGFDISEVGR